MAPSSRTSARAIRDLRGVDLDAELVEQPAAELVEVGTAEHAWPRQLDRYVDRDAAIPEHEHAVGEQDRLLDVVGDQERRG